jgi:hypothetical protein
MWKIIKNKTRRYNRRDIDNHCLAGSTRSWMGYKNPLCRVVPIYYTQKNNGKTKNYDKEKYRELILEAAETVLGYFGFDRNLYGMVIRETPFKNPGTFEYYCAVHPSMVAEIVVS